MLPEVSVITATYNSGPHLIESLRSVAAQQSVAYEHIVVDDGSTDKTSSTLETIASKNPNVVVITLRENVGPIRARNVALSHARGRFLAFLDADDLWLPGKLACQTRFMKERQCAMSYTDYRHMSTDGKRIGRLIVAPPSVDWIGHHITRYIGCLTVMLDRQLIENFEFPAVEPALRGEDFLAWSMALKKIEVAYRCPGDLARYRLARNTRSSRKLRAARSIWRIYREIESIPGHKAAWYFARYALHATWKHLYAFPRMSNY